MTLISPPIARESRTNRARRPGGCSWGIPWGGGRSDVVAATVARGPAWPV